MKKASELTEAEMAAKLVKGVEEDMQADSDMISGPTPTQRLLQDRGKTHGDWGSQSSLGYVLKDNARKGTNWDRLSPSQKEGLDMILTKISRILTGNPDHSDHWDDIAGYAKLVADRL